MCHTLIIEDEWYIADLMAEWAETAGARSVAFAVTEAEAVAEATANPPAFIISDVKLAEGTGPKAVERITSALGRIPTMFVTATPEDCIPCEDAVAVVMKPARGSDIIAIFRKHAPL